MESAPFELRVLGPTKLDGGRTDQVDANLRQPKRLALLAWLALETTDGFRRRDQIVGLFWPDLDQDAARTQLRKALFALRESLGSEAVTTRGETEVRLDLDRIRCDAVELVRHAKAHRWAETLALYRGELLEGLYPEGVSQQFEEWLADKRKSLRDQAAHAAWECCRIEEEHGDWKAAAVMARRALALSPDDEEGVRRLLALLDRHGDRGGALRVYSEWQARLQAEYGVEPAPETRKLARKIQAARKGESHETPPTPALPPISSVAAPTTSPPRQPLRAGRWIALAVVPLLLIVAALIARNGASGPPAPNSLAVLPLRVIGDPALAASAQAIEEELTTALIGDSALVVRSINRASEATGKAGDVDQIGRRLGVAYVLDGGLQGHSGGLRVTLRLVRANDGIARWAGSYDLQANEQGSAIRHMVTEVTRTIRTRVLSPIR